MRDLGVISGPVWRVIWEVHSGVNSEVESGQFWSILGNLIICTRIDLHLAVGRALNLEYTEFRVPEG